MPSPYTVRLVSPKKSAVKAQRIPPQKKELPPAKVEHVPEPKGVRAVEKAPPPPKKKVENLTKYTDEKIAALKKEKEMEQYREAKDRALADIRKQAKVKELGAQKASVEVTAKAVGEVGEGTILGDYIDMVSSLIQQEWVYFNAKGKDIFAIISIRVSKSGALSVSNIEQSSGDAVFDRSAVRAIKKASPVPPPPYEMELGVRFIPTE